MLIFPNDNQLLNLKAENATLFHTLQMHLNLMELDDLNIVLLEFVNSCLANRPNPPLNHALYIVKVQFGRFSK